MITRTRCPFIGLKEDPKTALSFPSQGNVCHHARPVAHIKGDYQQQYCLTSGHSACPIYQALQPQPLPPVIAAEPQVDSSPRRMMKVIGIPVLIAGAVALTLAWNVIGSRVGGRNSIPVTSMGMPGAWALLVTEAEPTQTASPTAEPTAPPSPTTCPMTPGWVAYIVKPTDSLYRLSVIYGVPVEQLQQANCLDDRSVIFPGQVLYVPNIPTNTPTLTITPVTIYPTRTPEPPSRRDDPPQPTNTSQPPVSEPASPKPADPKPTNKPVINDGSGKKDQDKKDDKKKKDDKDEKDDKDKDKGKGKGKGK